MNWILLGFFPFIIATCWDDGFVFEENDNVDVSVVLFCTEVLKILLLGNFDNCFTLVADTWHAGAFAHLDHELGGSRCVLFFNPDRRGTNN